MHIGLIGGGNISTTHARAARACGVEIAAVYGLNREKVGKLAAECHAAAYHDFHQFRQHRPMEMVAIGSPSGLHADHGIAVAEQGLHVLVEKPLDISTKRADALIAAAAHNRVKLGVFFQDRFKPDLIALKEFLRLGRLGRLLLVDAHVRWYRPPDYYRDSKWRGTPALDGGGALMNQGIHTVDLLLWLAGDVARAHAITRTAWHAIESEDLAVAVLEFQNGALGVLEAATCVYPGYPRRLEITGTEGTIVVENDRIVGCDLRNGDALVSSSGGDQNPQSNSPLISDIRGHVAVIADFLAAVETGGEPRSNGHEARRSVALIETIYASASRTTIETTSSEATSR